MKLHAGHYMNILIGLLFILYGIFYTKDTHKQIRRRGYASAIITLFPYPLVKVFWFLFGIVTIAMILLDAMGIM